MEVLTGRERSEAGDYSRLGARSECVCSPNELLKGGEWLDDVGCIGAAVDMYSRSGLVVPLNVFGVGFFVVQETLGDKLFFATQVECGSVTGSL